MPYRDYSTTNDTRTFINTGCIWNFVLSRTCRCFANDTVDLGWLPLIYPSFNPFTNSVNRHHLPEPFLWDTFNHLVEAAVAMRDGPQGDVWDFEIVHRDIKPGNSKTFQIYLSTCQDTYSMRISLFRRGERGKRVFFLPNCQNG